MTVRSHTDSSSKAEIARLTTLIATLDERIPKAKAALEIDERDRAAAARELRELKESIRFPLSAVLITFSRFGSGEKRRRPVRARVTPTQIVIPGVSDNTERRFSRENGRQIGVGRYFADYDVVELLSD